MNIKDILIVLLAVVFATGCNGQNKNYAEGVSKVARPLFFCKKALTLAG